jgi:2-oxoglutarate ferredoxin oxidoreductase subunit alpha
MKRKRFKKMPAILQRHGDRLVRLWGSQGEADVGVIAFGSLEGVIREATEEAEAEGIGVAHLHLRLLQPFPRDQVLRFASRCRTLMVPELTWSGQLLNWIKVNTGLEPTSLRKDDGLPFLPSEIHAKIRELATMSLHEGKRL